MATFKAVWAPKSQTGGISDAQNFTLLASGGTHSFTAGTKQIVQIVVAAPVFIRFSLGAGTAASTDMPLFSGILYEYDTGKEFDTINFLNNNGASTTLVGVMRMSKV